MSGGINQGRVRGTATLFGRLSGLGLALLAGVAPVVGAGAGGERAVDPPDHLAMFSFDPIPFGAYADRWEEDFGKGVRGISFRGEGAGTLRMGKQGAERTRDCLQWRAESKGDRLHFFPVDFALRKEHFWRLRLRVRAVVSAEVETGAGDGGTAAAGERRAGYLWLGNYPLAEGRETALGKREAYFPLTEDWQWVGLADVAPTGADRMRFELATPPGVAVEIEAATLDTETPPGWDRRVQPGPVERPAAHDRGLWGEARVQAGAAAPEVRDGYWLELPAWVQPVEGAGFFSLGNGLPEGYQLAVAHVFWRDVEPREGQFDFGPFAEAAAAGGQGFGVRFKTAEAERWPGWLEAGYGLKRFPVMSGGRPALEPWDPRFDAKYRAVYRALGEAGWLRDPRMRFWLFGGISASLGEENHFGEEVMRRFEAEGTLTPERFREWLFGRVDFLAGLFGDQVGNCALMTTGRGFAGEYGEISTEAFEYALERGFGLRGGHIENFYQFVGEARIGLRVDGVTGKLRVEEDHPFQQGRVFYNECENWSLDRADVVGPPEEWPYRYRQSLFSSLYQRYQFMGMNADMLRRFPAISRYFLLGLGRRAETSPEGFAYLREGFIRGFGRVLNWERWLEQVETEGSRSVPGLMARRTRMGIGDPNRIAFDFEGRSTDLERGQYRFDFQADSRVLGAGYTGPVDVYVTFWNEGGSRFAVYARTRAGWVRTPEVTVGKGRGFRTARFRLESLAGSRGREGGPDFSVVVENNRNLVVTLVRAVRVERVGTIR